MKALSLVALFALVSTTAHASYFQVDCSNASATVRMQSGHVANGVQIERLVRVDTGMVRGETIQLPLDQANVKELSVTKVSRDAETKCPEDSRSGLSTWKEITVKKVKITRADGTPFPEWTFERAADGSVVTTLICELDGNSRGLCEDTSDRY